MLMRKHQNGLRADLHVQLGIRVRVGLPRAGKLVTLRFFLRYLFRPMIVAETFVIIANKWTIPYSLYQYRYVLFHVMRLCLCLCLPKQQDKNECLCNTSSPGVHSSSQWKHSFACSRRHGSIRCLKISGVVATKPATMSPAWPTWRCGSRHPRLFGQRANSLSARSLPSIFK